MRVLLVSDIHANLVALNRVLSTAGAFDALWCLGDIVGYGPAPNECVERLRELQVVSLAGNHDWAVVGKLSVEDFNANARRAVEWTQTVLTSDNLEWLDQLPDRMLLAEHDLTLVHGSPRYPIWEYIMNSGIATENLSYFDTHLCLYGHTHVPVLWEKEEGKPRVTPQALPGEEPLDLRGLGKALLNPGSVGQPRDRDPRAAYALLDLDVGTLAYRRVDYDIAATQAAMARVGLPRPLIERLDYGV